MVFNNGSPNAKPCTAFKGNSILTSGPLIEVALAVKSASEQEEGCAFLTFDDVTGHVVDLDLRGTKADVIGRLVARFPAPSEPPEETASEVRGRGRPKLGVIAREITLLPRHWEWLADQPGGASVTLRKLVDEARRTGSAKQQRRAAHEAAYRFISAMAGDWPGFEEATRALFADNRASFEAQIAEWPSDVRDYAVGLAFSLRRSDDDTMTRVLNSKESG